VSWFRKKKHRIDLIREPIPMTTILRWMLYDVGVQDDKKLTALIGLTPVSDEGNSKEIEDSEDRLNDIYDILPFAEMISSMSADMIATMHTKDVIAAELVDEIDPQEIEIMKALYKSIAMTATISAFSTGVKLGLIEINASHLSQEDMENIYEF
jgi:hypothetical protein